MKSQHKVLPEAMRRAGHNPDICWIRSHPELRKTDNNSWSTQEWGIFLADMLAEGNFSYIEHLKGGFYRTPLALMMQQLLIPGTWYWSRTDSATPTTQSLVQLHSEKRVHEYLKQRDKYRRVVDETAEPRWEGTSLALANRCWKTLAKTFVQQNIALRHILDKYWNGRNRAKGLYGQARKDALKCLVCRGEDSQRHLILDCRHEDLDDIRQQARENLQIELENLEEDMLINGRYQQSIALFIYEQAFNTSYPDIDRLWLGTWNHNVLADAIAYTFYRSNLTNELTQDDLTRVHLIFTKLTVHLNKAILQLQKVHGRICRLIEAPAETDEHPAKRRRTLAMLDYSEEPVDMEISKPRNPMHEETKKKPLRLKRSYKAAKIVKWPRQQKPRKRIKRSRQAIPDVRRELLSQVSNMDVVVGIGASHPRGETQDVDYDRD